MNTPIFIILGATGDLTKRKLIPAIYRLVENEKIESFALIGAAFTDTTIDQILQDSRPFISNINEEIWQKLKKASTYCKLDFHNKNDFVQLKKCIEETERGHSSERIFYLATLPDHFAVITKNLALHDLVKEDSKVIYEKPFGHNLTSARKINRCVTKLFHESQIYRIDHYLWDELVGNIILIRFSNLLFEPLWNKDFIESVQIVLNESVCVEGRGHFYDAYGALKDVVQNHMLQILSLITMEPPLKLSDTYIRDAKAKVLKKLVLKDVLVGQYEGYQEENGVAPESKTETFAAVVLNINNKRWKGVPFYLKTGKCLDNKETSILVKFKTPKCLKAECPMGNNYLSIHIAPREGFFLGINTKVPGLTYETTPITMDFCHPCKFGPNSPQAYETLLSGVLRGDQTAFVSFHEIEHSWKLIDQIVGKKGTLYRYAKGSKGPIELTAFCKKHNV